MMNGHPENAQPTELRIIDPEHVMLLTPGKVFYLYNDITCQWTRNVVNQYTELGTLVGPAQRKWVAVDFPESKNETPPTINS